MARVLFDIRNVTYRYDHKVMALDGLSLQIEEGRRVVLLGANGSGKSTLLRLLDALYFPESGSITFAGLPLMPASLRDEQTRFAFRRQVGLVFQDPDAQLFNATVFDEVAFGPLQLRWPKPEILERVGEALTTMGIAHLQDRVPHRLSGGEKKRVAIASVLVLNPEVLLLDEPTSGLDPRSQSRMIDLIAGLNDAGKTVISATHDLSIVEDIADTCHVLDGGKLVSGGPPADILADFELLQRTNLIHAHRHRHGDQLHSHPHQHGHGQHRH